jgi:hypothetical protein
MKTADFYVGYRPVRLGLLVRNNNFEDLLSAVELNTLLWGGIFNPIIPIGENNLLVDNLINSLQIDYLLPLNQSAELIEVPNKYPHLGNHISKMYGLYQDDWKTKKKILSYLDINHLINFYWEKEFKHSKRGNSNCVSLGWSENDELKNMFAVEFGFFGNQEPLKHNYFKNYLNGLRAKEVKIKKIVPKSISGMIPPIKFTKSRLSYTVDEYNEAGFFVGDPNNYLDIINFWNVRASGRSVFFYPFGKSKRMNEYAKSKVESLSKIPSRYDNYEEPIRIYHTSVDFESCKKISSIFKTKKPFGYYNVGDLFWNKKYFQTSMPRFDDKIVTAIIQDDEDKYRVTIPLPEKPIWEEILETQQYVISVKAISDYPFSGHTLSLPYLPDLNEFYRRKISLGSDSIRVGRDRIGFLENHSGQSSINLFPLKKQDR